MTLRLEKNNLANEHQNIADFGARRVLGINGSLTSYINTGNAYGDLCDINPDKTSPKQDKPKHSCSYLWRTLGSCLALTTGAAVLVCRAKKVKIKPLLEKNTKKISNFFKSNFAKVKKFFTKK